MTDDDPTIDMIGHTSSQRVRTRPGGRRRFGGDPDTPPRRRPSRALAVLATAGAATVLAAGGTLAAATFGTDDEDAVRRVGDTSRSAAPGSCTWSQQVDGPVFPANDAGPRPSAESVMVFERCDGEWTANVAWLDRGDNPRVPDGDGVTAIAGRATRPSCVWVTQRDGPVVPSELYRAASSADAMLMFEYCGAAWTGHMAWLDFRSVISTTGSDDGLPNPWEAGNRAVEQWLEGRGGQGPPG